MMLFCYFDLSLNLVCSNLMPSLRAEPGTHAWDDWHVLRWIWSTGLLPKDCQSYYAEIQILWPNDFPALVPARLNTLDFLATS